MTPCPGSGATVHDGELFVRCGDCGHLVQLTADAVADVLPLDRRNRWMAGWVIDTVRRVIDHATDKED